MRFEGFLNFERIFASSLSTRSSSSSWFLQFLMSVMNIWEGEVQKDEGAEGGAKREGRGGGGGQNERPAGRGRGHWASGCRHTVVIEVREDERAEFLQGELGKAGVLQEAREARGEPGRRERIQRA